MLKIFFKKYSQSNYVSGKVKVNSRTCTGCQQCILICPASALELNSQKKSKMKNDADCISCGACVAVCHTNSIQIATFFHIPDGAYQTLGRMQKPGKQAFPREFKDSNQLKKGS